MESKFKIAMTENSVSDKLCALLFGKRKPTAKEVVQAYENYLVVLRDHNKVNTIIAIESGFMPDDKTESKLHQLWQNVEELKKQL